MRRSQEREQHLDGKVIPGDILCVDITDEKLNIFMLFIIKKFCFTFENIY
jgi:hypothetical protein